MNIGGKAMTKEEYDAYVDEHGHGPDDAPQPGQKNRNARNHAPQHDHHTRGIG